MLSDATIKRMNELRECVKEIMRVFGVPEDRAWQMAAANGSYKAYEQAKKYETAQKRSLAALASTFKSNVED